MTVTIRTLAPVILAEATGAVDRPEMQQLTEAIDRFVTRRERFLVVVDVLEVSGITAAARQLAGQHRKGHRGKAEPLDMGLLLAVRSPVIRGALTAISWVSGELDGLRTVESRRELSRVAREILAKEGVRPSDELASALLSLAR
ncbi:MAG: hypothetical protein J0L92_26875 [Deltaproteobacteria bacterium]|nr:hypothetical protein [Deltaproteobacteria bacterium]